MKEEIIKTISALIIGILIIIFSVICNAKMEITCLGIILSIMALINLINVIKDFKKIKK